MEVRVALIVDEVPRIDVPRRRRFAGSAIVRAVEGLVQVVVFRVPEAARRRAARRNVRARLEDAPARPAELGPALAVRVGVRRQRRDGQRSVLRSGSRRLHLLEDNLLFERLRARRGRSIRQVLAILARLADVIQRDAVQVSPALRPVRTCCRHIYSILGEHNLLVVALAGGRGRDICIVIALLFPCARSRRGGHQVLGVVQIVGVLRLLGPRRRAGRGAMLADAEYFAQTAVAAANALIGVMKVVENLRICV